MNNKIIRCESTTTFSSLVGNLTSFFTLYFQSKFPVGFFKKVFISDSLNSSNLENEDIQKYPLPLLTIKPELSMDSIFMDQLPTWYTQNSYIDKSHGARSKVYTNILRDEEKGIYIYSIPTRVKINFNIRIKLPTTMFMYNTLNVIQNKFENNGYFYCNNVNLQTEVPKIMMIALAEELGLNLNTVDDREKFNDYLSKVSLNKITENINLSNGNSNYAYNFKSNILLNYPDRAQGNKNIKNLVVSDTVIDYVISTECWYPNKFFIEYPNNKLLQMKEIVEEVLAVNDKYKFNIVIDTDYIQPMINGNHLLIKKSFLPDINVEYDVLDFKLILYTELVTKLLNKEIFDIRVMCGNKNLSEKLYTIDYNNYTIKTFMPMSNTTYTVLIYGNLEKLNKVSEMILNGTIDELEYL
jgi:hypothetical protein